MFLITRTADHISDGNAARGCERYIALSELLLGRKLTLHSFAIGGMTIRVLLREGEQQPLTVHSESGLTAVVFGRPSALESDGGDVAALAEKLIGTASSTVSFTSRLQGDYSLFLTNGSEWELEPDPVGFGRVYWLQRGERTMVSDTLFLLAASERLELDPLGCGLLNLCYYMFGGVTVFKNVRLVEMGYRLVHNTGGTRVEEGYKLTSGSGETTAEGLTAAYLDALKPRFHDSGYIRHCMTGGTDSRVVLGMLTAVGLKPEVFSWRWEPGDTNIAHQLANAAGLDYFSSGGELYLSPEPTIAANWGAESFVLDGGLVSPFTSRNYLFGLKPGDKVVKGTYGESTIKSIWGVGYAGMANPKPDKVIARLLDVGLIRSGSDPQAFADPQLSGAVREKMTAILTAQAREIEGADHTKLCNWLYIRNRGARWAAQTMGASNRFTDMEIPLSYPAGVGASWRIPVEQYHNIRIVRDMIRILDPRLAAVPFVDGSSAQADTPLEELHYFYHRKVKKAEVMLLERFFGMTSKRRRGLLRPQSYHAEIAAKKQREWHPERILNPQHQLSTAVYRPFDGSLETVAKLERSGDLHNVLMLEFAARIYDGDMEEPVKLLIGESDG